MPSYRYARPWWEHSCQKHGQGPELCQAALRFLFPRRIHIKFCWIMMFQFAKQCRSSPSASRTLGTQSTASLISQSVRPLRQTWGSRSIRRRALIWVPTIKHASVLASIPSLQELLRSPLLRAYRWPRGPKSNEIVLFKYRSFLCRVWNIQRVGGQG